MPVQVFDYDVSLDTCLDESSASLTRIQAHPLTAPMAADFEAMQEEILAVSAKEALLRIGIQKAMALVAVADDELDAVSDATSKTILIETGGDSSSPLYTLFFGDKRPSDFRRPVLGDQLGRMAEWVPHLQKSPIPALKAISDSVEAKVNAGYAAIAALSSAKQANKEFRVVGERKALIDKFNALRKSTYGKLSELPHKYPDKNLPNTFAERFFKHTQVKKKTEEKAEPTAEELKGMIAECEATTATLKEQLADVVAKEEAAAKIKADIEAKKAALAEAQMAAKEALAKVAELEASIPAAL
jgi:hypothetical protein